MSLVSERIPHRDQVQHESLHGSLTRNGRRTGSRLGFIPRTVDFHRPRLGVDQPGQLSAVCQPLLHLVAQHANPVRLRAQFDHEVRANRPVTAKGSRVQVLDAVFENPGRIWRAPGGVGQQPTRGRVEGHTAFVLPGPIGQLAADFIIPRSRPSEGLRHDEQFPVGGQFEIEGGVLGTQLGEGFVGHRTDGQDRGQVGLINDERHKSQYRRCPAQAARARFHRDGAVTIATAGPLSSEGEERELAMRTYLPLGMAVGSDHGESQVRGERFTFVSDGVVAGENAQRDIFGFERTREISTPSAPKMAAAQAWGQNN